MNAKNLPIKVIEEWQQIAEFIKAKMAEFGLPFEIKQDKRFGLKISYKPYRKIYFEIYDFELQHYNNYTAVEYDVIQFPKTDLQLLEIQPENLVLLNTKWLWLISRRG